MLLVSSRLQLKSSRSSKLKKNDASHFAFAEAVNHVQAAYATSNVIANSVITFHFFTHGPSLFAAVYPDTLWTKVLRCVQSYDEALLKLWFIEGFQSSIRHSMRVY